MKFPEQKTLVYNVLVVDYDECAFGSVYTDGSIEIKWHHHSSVPHKMKVGGQSAARFSRIRDNEITAWFKRIDEYLKPEDEFYLGMNPIYYKRFFKTLHTYNQEKIRERLSTEYSGITGVYQFVKRLESDKMK